MDISISPLPIIKFNVPEWYKDRDFLTFLNSSRVATWHRQYCKPDAYSDVFLTYCQGERSDAYYPINKATDKYLDLSEPEDSLTIPDRCWRIIHEYCQTNGIQEALIWLTNLE